MRESSSFTEQLAASAERLFELIDYFSLARVLVVGDLTLDEFLTGSVEPISTEATDRVKNYIARQKAG